MAEGTDFLYPFIEGDERDAAPLLADLATSVRVKSTMSSQVRAGALERNERVLTQAARAMAACFGAGGRLFTFGNGGSSTDASLLAELFAHPPRGRALPARCLVDDAAVLTALGNDVGFELVFSRQLIAHAAPGDIVFGCSTSGNSHNLVRAFEHARGRGMLTVATSGYDGGEIARVVDHCLIVGNDSVHRIQETQAALGLALWDLVQRALPAGTSNG